MKKGEFKMRERLRVATYNVGDFSGENMPQGSEKSRSAFIEVFEKTNADVWALQEDVEFFNEETKELPFDAIYKHIHPNFKGNYTHPYNGKAFLSKFSIENAEAIKYYGETPFDHPWFYKVTITVDSKEITFITLHFDWSDKVVRAEQIRQIIEFAKKEKYCIITGDFNPEDYLNREKLSTNLFYKEELARFKEEGFEVTNAGKFGVFDTIVRPTRPDTNRLAFDNILVSSNIKIVSVGRSRESWMYDHAILYSDLEIN